MTDYFVLHYRKIVFVSSIVILSILIALFFPKKGEVETNGKNIIMNELNDIFRTSQATYKMIYCNIGEGNDSWVELNFAIEVFSFHETRISHHKFNMLLEPKQKYLIRGVASFAGNAYIDKWHFQRIDLTEGVRI